jgi:hypothetical protein
MVIAISQSSAEDGMKEIMLTIFIFISQESESTGKHRFIDAKLLDLQSCEKRLN